MAAMPSTPPTVPPAIAPTLVEELGLGLGVAVGKLDVAALTDVGGGGTGVLGMATCTTLVLADVEAGTDFDDEIELVVVW